MAELPVISLLFAAFSFCGFCNSDRAIDVVSHFLQLVLTHFVFIGYSTAICRQQCIDQFKVGTLGL
jgi:hypothetical protein